MAGSRARILIVDDAVGARAVLRANLEGSFEVVGEAGNGREAVQLAAELRPDIVVMDLTLPIMGGMEATQVLSRRFPEMAVVILSGDKQLDTVRAAMAAGAREYFFKPVEIDAAIASLERLHGQQLERARVMAGAPGLPGAGIWAFCGAGGGSGRTTTMLGLANELLTLGRKVVVVDLDMLCGNICFMLGLEPQGPDLSTVLGDGGQVPGSPGLRKSLQVHASGLHALLAPTNPAKGLALAPAASTEVVLALRELFDYVLVDMPPGLADGILPILDEARYVLPVGRGDRVGVKNLASVTRLLGTLGYGPMKILPLATMCEKPELAAYARTLAVDFTQSFPRDAEACDRAIRLGQPVSRIAPKSPLTLAIRDALVPILKLVAPPGVAAPSRSFLEMLLG